MSMKNLTEYLDRQHVTYDVLEHDPAYTAQETAAVAHIPGREMAKTVIVVVDGQMAMAVLPAHQRLDLKQLKQAAGAKQVAICHESDFVRTFPDCEPGAMPPFGNLFNMQVYVADSLMEDDEIAFNAGSHTELIRMSYDDYVRLVHPKVVHLTSPMD